MLKIISKVFSKLIETGIDIFIVLCIYLAYLLYAAKFIYMSTIDGCCSPYLDDMILLRGMQAYLWLLFIAIPAGAIRFLGNKKILAKVVFYVPAVEIIIILFLGVLVVPFAYRVQLYFLPPLPLSSILENTSNSIIVENDFDKIIIFPPIITGKNLIDWNEKYVEYKTSLPIDEVKDFYFETYHKYNYEYYSMQVGQHIRTYSYSGQNDERFDLSFINENDDEYVVVISIE